MNTWGSITIAILGLALLMVVHEGGHFLVARAYGMRVTKFSIGFGPPFFRILPEDGYFWFITAAGRVRLRLWRHDPVKHGPTVYQVAMIPFLAYVQVAGMNPLEDIEPEDKGSYANASLIARILTIFGGPLANYLFASVFYFMSFFFFGVPAPLSTDVSVLENRPAAAAGIKTGDHIVEINQVKVDDWSQMAAEISKHPGEAVPIVVERGGQRITLTVTPGEEGGKGKIGVAPSIPPLERRVPVTTKEAAIEAVKYPPVIVKSLIVGIDQLIHGKPEGELSGPIGIVKATAAEAKRGWAPLLEILGAISAYLGAFNLLPVPALDGGRLMFLGYEAATRRRPNARLEAHVHLVGFLMIFLLVTWITFAKDLGK